MIYDLSGPLFFGAAERAVPTIEANVVPTSLITDALAGAGWVVDGLAGSVAIPIEALVSLPFDALTAIHMAHRVMSVIVLVALLWLAQVLRRVPALRKQSHAIWGLAVWQLLSGLSNVVMGWPLLAAVAHTGGAAGLVVVLTWATCSSRTAIDTVSASKLNATRLTT